MNRKFESWLATYLAADETEVRKLLNHELARYFLIVWSIYEAKCFGGYVKKSKLATFAEGKQDKLKDEFVDEQAHYFHKRYQCSKKRINLIHKNSDVCFNDIIDSDFGELTKSKKVYLLVFVTYRYRNNIFHGNKGVSSWIKYHEQIERCIAIVQHLIDVTVADVPVDNE